MRFVIKRSQSTSVTGSTDSPHKTELGPGKPSGGKAATFSVSFFSLGPHDLPSAPFSCFS